MNKNANRSGSGMGLALAFLLVLGAGQARALDVLTFDVGNPERNETIGGLGISVTHVGSNAVSGLDFSMFDIIYLSLSVEDLFKGGFLASLGLRAGDLKTFVSNGGSLVFGSPSGGNHPNLNGSGNIHAAPYCPPTPETAGPGLAAPVTAVPEPGTFALFGLGAAGLFLIRRRMADKT